MDFIIQLLLKTLLQVWTTFTHNWPFLLVSVIIAVCLKLYIKPDKVSAFLTRYRRAGVVGATVAAVTTPLCSCGTTAIILGMMASTIPWSPIIAFMVASPLTSPEELIYSAGLFGWPFAIAFFASSILLGLLGGLVGEILERRGWLANQARFSTASTAGEAAPRGISAPETVRMPVTAPMLATASAPAGACACSSASTQTLTAPASVFNRARPAPVAASSREAVATLSIPCGCGSNPVQTVAPACSCGQPEPVQASESCSCAEKQAVTAQPAITWRLFLAEALTTGRRLLVMFLGFAFIGYLLNGLIPPAWVNAIFGPGNIYSVPLAATLGLPLYINTEASLPLVRALIEGGMSQGAAMAFLITGAGTSIGAIAGAFTIARWRVIFTVIATLWIGAIAMGFLYDLLLAAGLF